nr:hypothetical protein 44 [bacterium]
MVCASAGDNPNAINLTLLRPMFNKLDPITAESIRFIIEQAESKGDEAVQADWAGTEALEIYNEFKDQELKSIPGTDLAFNELLKTHVNAEDLFAGGNLITVEQGDTGWGTYRGDFVGINSDVTETNQNRNVRVAGSPITIQARQGNDAIYGNDQADRLYGSEVGNETAWEGFTYTDRRYSDHDYIRSGGGDDFAFGGGGNDFIEGNEGHDFLRGDDGHDIILGGKGNDSMYGDAGNDILVAGLGDDTLTGGEGIDVFLFDGNPLMHFYTNTINEYQGDDVVMFTDTFENLNLTVEADLNASQINVVSGITGMNVLEINVDSKYAQVGSSTIFGMFSQGGQLENLDTDNPADSTHQYYANLPAQSFMEYGV